MRYYIEDEYEYEDEKKFAIDSVTHILPTHRTPDLVTRNAHPATRTSHRAPRTAKLATRAPKPLPRNP